MPAEGVAEIVVSYDMSQGMHPALQPAIHQFPGARNIIYTKLAISGIALLSVCTEENNIQMNKVEVAKGFLCS